MTISLTQSQLNVLGGKNFNGLVGERLVLSEPINYSSQLGGCINITNCENCTVDLNGYSLIGGFGGGGQATGINIYNSKGIRVTNGSTRGFRYGILATEDGGNLSPAVYSPNYGGHTVDHISGSAQWRLIKLQGRSCEVEHIDAFRIGGDSAPGHSTAAEFSGPGSIAYKISVRDTFASVQVVGAETAPIMFGDQNEGLHLKDFTLVNYAIEPLSIGIWIGNASDGLIEDGFISGFDKSLNIAGSGLIRNTVKIINCNSSSVAGWTVEP